MDAVLRSVAIYLFLLVLLRVAGQRTLAEMTTFEFVLLLVIGEATQQGLLGNDFSITNAFLVITTLIGIDIAFSLLQQRSQRLKQWIEGPPVVLVDNGRPIKERMEKTRVDESDILEKARELQGLERMDQIKYAVLESNGGITIIPMQSASS